MCVYMRARVQCAHVEARGQPQVLASGILATFLESESLIN